MKNLAESFYLTSFHAWPQFRVDALFVHGNVDLQLELLDLAAEFFKKNKVAALVVNGMTEKECVEQKINCLGIEKTLAHLQNLGVPTEAVHSVRPARHTLEEAQSLHRLAQQKNWKHLGFLSLPYHTLRCALTHLAAQKQASHRISLHPLNLSEVIWSQKVAKQLLGQEQIQISRLQMIQEEMDRIERYQKKGDCVSFAELVAHFST